MPIANVSNQATVSAAQLKLCPHPYISAPTPWVRRERSGTPALPPRPVINWGQKRQTQGRDVSTRIKEETGATYHKLGHLRIKKASLIWSLRLPPSWIAAGLTGHGLPLSKCEAYNRGC